MIQQHIKIDPVNLTMGDHFQITYHVTTGNATITDVYFCNSPIHGDREKYIEDLETLLGELLED